MAQSTSLRKPTRSQEANAKEKASARSARNDSFLVGGTYARRTPTGRSRISEIDDGD
jgi:hypothetical protein